VDKSLLKILQLHEPYTIMTRNKLAMTHTEQYCTMNMKIITYTFQETIMSLSQYIYKIHTDRKERLCGKDKHSSSSSSIFNVNIITPTSRGDILRQIVSSVYIT